ncbi:MAG: hypothetical protein A2X32_07845 [Elusimicrobia bacterium GWC2_64_44]|nr:MAG: hypothetical protein A2X32_07845 [Elusimicrobia bacterium GWC2_64_44]
MKTLLLSLTLLAGSLPAAAAPKTYADAQNDLGWLSHSVAFHRKTLGESIKQQSSNLETLNRLNQTKIVVEDMIRRDNFAKACKVAEVGFTVATVGAGGVALATTQGLSVLSREGIKVAGKYIAQKGAVEAGKEALGVPGWSDAAKAGVFVFNKFDENELKGQLSRDNVAALLKAKQLLENDGDGRTLQDKLPELRQMILDMESEVEATATKIKAADKLIDDALAEARKLAAEGALLKDKEQKAAEKAYEEAKKARPAGLVNTEVSRPAEVPAPQAGPQDTPEEKRRKMQAAIDKYIASLSAAINRAKKAADEAWPGVSRPKGNVRFQAGDELQDLYAGLAYQEENLGGERTYMRMESVEYSADSAARSIAACRAGLETQRADIKARIEPFITGIAGSLGQWRSAYNAYKPLGYHVPEPDDLKNMTLWNSYYELPLKYAETYLQGTEGLEGKFAAVAAKARAQKDAIYSETKEFMAALAARHQAFKEHRPQAAARMEKLTAEAAKHFEILNTLGHNFVMEFSYDGKYDLANLEARVAAAKPAFAEAQRLYAAGALVYSDLYARYDELQRLDASPARSEAGSIAGMAANKAHKDEMAAALKKLEGHSPSLNGADGTHFSGGAGAEQIFAAEAALKYLRAQETRLVAVYTRAISAFKANTAGDLARLGSLPDEEYGKAVEKLFEPVQKAEQEQARIIEETRKAELFGHALLERTGFWTVQAGAKRDELEKLTGAFWGGPKGKAISDARRGAEVQAAQHRSDPGLAVVRKMYEDFARAYQGRNAAKVMQFIAPDWTAGDGTTATDLEEQFRNIFRIYDEITVSITGLQVVNNSPGSYAASYSMAIKSRIYQKNIRREENSSVYETVTVEGNSARIKKTESGGYWEIK